MESASQPAGETGAFRPKSARTCKAYRNMTVFKDPGRANDPASSSEGLRPEPRPADRSKSFGPLIVAVVACIALFVLLCAVSLHDYTPDSDAATVALEGQAMAHGHLLLNGWSIPLDSFWTVDALWYLAAIVPFGLDPVALNLVPAAIAAAVILLGVVMAVEDRRGTAAFAAGGVVIAILALPSHAWAFHFLRGPLHIGTALWCLVAFLALRRGKFGWGFAIAVIFLAAGLLGDLQMLGLGIAPVFLAGLTAIARRRNWQAGLAQVTAAVSAVVLAEVIRRIASAIGTFSIARANPVATFSQMIANLGQAAHELVALMGVGSAFWGLGADPSALSYVHLLAVVVVLASVAGTVVAVASGALHGRPSVVGASSEAAWRLDDMLLFGALGSLATFVLLAVSLNPGYGRYLTAGIIFAVILTGRVVGRVAQHLRWAAAGRIATATGLAASGCYAAGMVINLDQPVPVSQAAVLASFLESHDLHEGIGAYWAASIVTVESKGRVAVRPVVSPDGHHLAPYGRNSAAYWYTGAFQFLVFSLGSSPWGGVDAQTAVNTLGPASRSYVVDNTYRVMVWNQPFHLPPAIPAG